MRKMIERVFAEAETWHRMMRARYRGLERVAIQVLMTFICLNAKKMAHRARLASEIATKMTLIREYWQERGL
ncbi:hypothetical protein TC41_1879 [Calderihabitans maritimus]|uniref:Transposase DDE domain-containing protein n=2 Tax=Calderihabitans maritimus TaxID=1246530 RepID=A0A1Z5HWU5_9FIRM|nr:hypothetical protein TC41_1879 [Calderihabitans maritimus]